MDHDHCHNERCKEGIHAEGRRNDEDGGGDDEEDYDRDSMNPPVNPSVNPSVDSGCWWWWSRGGTILFWYLISNAIIWTTKWLFTAEFPYPLTVTAYSNCVASAWALAVAFSGITGETPVLPSKRILREYVGPIGALTALEIGCSNLALKILTVSFGTILKGTGPVFTFAWSLALGLESFSWPVAASLAAIAGGIALASFGEGQNFQLAGFLLQLGATAMGGLRWSMTHRLLQGQASHNDPDSNTHNGQHDAFRDDEEDEHEDERDHEHDLENLAEISDDSNELSLQGIQPMSPLIATLYTSPVTSLCVLPFAIALEWGSPFATDSQGNDNDHNESTTTHHPSIILAAMTLIATLVFVLLMSEYWLVRATSSLALSVAAVGKELLTIAGGVLFFSETVDALNAAGFFVCQAGILSYVCLRTTRTTTTTRRHPSYTRVFGPEDDQDHHNVREEDAVELA